MLRYVEEEGLECEVHVDGIRLEHLLEFKYLGCVLDESGTYGAKCSRKVVSGRRAAGAIRSLVNAMDLQLEFLVLVLMYGNDIMLWREKKIFRMRAVQMDNLRGLLSIMRMDRAPNARIRELCRVKKGSAMWRVWREIGLRRESM